MGEDTMQVRSTMICPEPQIEALATLPSATRTASKDNVHAVEARLLPRCQLHDAPTALPESVGVTTISKIRETLIRGFWTSDACMLSKHMCPSSLTMRTVFSPRFGIEKPLAATKRTHSEPPFGGTMGVSSRAFKGAVLCPPLFVDSPAPQISQGAGRDSPRSWSWGGVVTSSRHLGVVVCVGSWVRRRRNFVAGVSREGDVRLRRPGR